MKYPDKIEYAERYVNSLIYVLDSKDTWDDDGNSMFTGYHSQELTEAQLNTTVKLTITPPIFYRSWWHHDTLKDFDQYRVVDPSKIEYSLTTGIAIEFEWHNLKGSITEEVMSFLKENDYTMPKMTANGPTTLDIPGELRLMMALKFW